MTGTYVLLGSTFIVTTSFILSICAYCVVLIIRFYKKQNKSIFNNDPKEIVYSEEGIHEEQKVFVKQRNVQENDSTTSQADSQEFVVDANPKCGEFFKVCCCLIFEDPPHCFEMCWASLLCGRGKKYYCQCFCKGKHPSLHTAVKLIASVSLVVGTLAMVFYVCSALDSIITCVLPMCTILHLVFIIVLLLGAVKEKRFYLLPWMIFSWISWLSLLPCVFGSLTTTKKWALTFENSFVIASVSGYFVFNIVSWILVKSFYTELILEIKNVTRRESYKNGQSRIRLENNIGGRTPPHILVCKADDDDDEIDGNPHSSTNNDYTVMPTLEFDPSGDQETVSSKNYKMKVPAGVAMAAMALKHTNENTSSHLTKTGEESIQNIKPHSKKGEQFKKGAHPEQRMPGIIPVHGISNSNQYSSSAHRQKHQGVRDRGHGGRNVEGKRQIKGQGKGMRTGARLGGDGGYDGIGADNNNRERSDSKTGELFNFLVDVGGILEEQYNEQEEERSGSRSPDSGTGGSRKGRKQRSGSVGTFLLITDNEELEKSPDKKSNMQRNKKMGLQSRSATNLTVTAGQEDLLSGLPARKKELRFAKEGSSGRISTKKQQFKNLSKPKMKMPKTKLRR